MTTSETNEPNFIADPAWYYYQHYHNCLRAKKFIENTLEALSTAEGKTFEIEDDCDNYLVEARAAIDSVLFTAGNDK